MKADKQKKNQKEKLFQARAGKPPINKPNQFSRTGICVFCGAPADLKSQKTYGMFIFCRFCGNRIHLNSQVAEIGYFVLENRLQQDMSTGSIWFNNEFSRCFNNLSRDWKNEAGLIKPRKTMEVRSGAKCPLCGQIGRLSVGKEGNGMPTFGCASCSVRIFFRTMKGFTGFHVQSFATAKHGRIHIGDIENLYRDEIIGETEPLTREGCEKMKEQEDKRSRDRKEALKVKLLELKQEAQDRKQRRAANK